MKKPVIHPSAFVADNATVRGSVTLGANSSVFFGAVLRGDRAPITIGAGTNIQDNCVVHVDYDHPVTVGENVTVGHGAILHGCTVGDNTLIGMGAIVLNGAKVGSNCLIGAGALVPQNVEIPDGSLAFGSPAKIKGQLDEAAIAELRQAALAEYQQEGKALQNQYSMLDAQEKADYDRWQAARGDWQKQLEAAQAAYEDAGSQDQKLYQTLLAHFSDKAEQERKLSASGVRLTDSGDTGSRGESLSSTAAESLQRAVVNYLKRGNGDLAQALAAQYTARMTPAQRQRFEKLLGQYGMTLA